ncbi:hypothetical protein [Streptomyces sp. NPDC005968]|uniref:hypothetical protein n=1 Tax=Streptomyces sp. NPDC005968 TaxID=3154574 RepID=UPI0033DBFBC4
MPAPPGPSAGPGPPSAGTAGLDGGPGPECIARTHPRIHVRRTEDPDGTDTFVARSCASPRTTGAPPEQRLPFLAALLVGGDLQPPFVLAGAVGDMSGEHLTEELTAAVHALLHRAAGTGGPGETGSAGKPAAHTDEGTAG